MKKEICFDMDGTIADLYGVEGWLEDLKELKRQIDKILKEEGRK